MLGTLRIVLIVVASAALSAAAYGASKSSGGSSHGSSSHGSSGSSHSSKGGDSKGGKSGGKESKGKGDSKGRHEARGRDGHVYAGFAGVFRNPLFWLYWPFAWYSTPEQLVLTCGEDVADVTALPIDQYHQALEPTEALGPAVDDLALAVTKAVQGIKISCPAEMALTAPARMAALQRRVEAMIAAVELVQPPLEKFYGLLNDEQKAKVNALGMGPPPPGKPDDSPFADCGPSLLAGLELPAAAIDRVVHLSDDQRKSLLALQNTDTQAGADLLKVTCGLEMPITPPARVAAVRKRLDVLIAAVVTVSAAVNDFYGTLSDEQKAKIQAVGPVLVAEDEPPVAVGPGRRFDGPPRVEQVIKRLLPF
jgi:LTXXQ motif family protein